MLLARNLLTNVTCSASYICTPLAASEELRVCCSMQAGSKSCRGAAATASFSSCKQAVKAFGNHIAFTSTRSWLFPNVIRDLVNFNGFVFLLNTPALIDRLVFMKF